MESKSDKPILQIMKHLLIIGVTGSAVNTCILAACAAKGRWIGDEPSCQVYAFMSFSQVTLCILISTLATMERQYALVDMYKHTQIFSPLNNKIILTSLYIMAFLLCAGPLYGWGEYSDLRGQIQVTSSLEIRKINTSATCTFCSNFTNNSHFDNAISCQPVKISEKEILINVIKKSSLAVIRNTWNDIRTRPSFSNCAGGQILFLLRAQTLAAVENLTNSIVSGDFDRTMEKVLENQFTSLNIGVKFSSVLNEKLVNEYKKVFVTFQSIGVCSLDFSAVNSETLSSAVYIVTCIIIIPCLVMILNGIIIMKHTQFSSCRQYVQIKFVKTVFVGGLLNGVMCVPYFIMNFLNLKHVIIPKETNMIVTCLFYCSPLCISCPFIMEYIMRFRCWRSHLHHQDDITELHSIEDTDHARCSTL